MGITSLNFRGSLEIYQFSCIILLAIIYKAKPYGLFVYVCLFKANKK